jgi:NAD(P) transhydrogenase subunit alpha
MIVGIAKETSTGEKRVSIVPEVLSKFKGVSVVLEKSAGETAGFPDNAYSERGVSIVDTQTLYGQSDIILKVQPPSEKEARMFKKGSVLISLLYPNSNLGVVRTLVQQGVTALAMELMPRISRAQSMDVLSSQAIISGYKAVLIAADSFPKFLPMLMTAAGTVPPAKVFVIGAGVAGLQAIATARRLGAVVEAYDVRPVAKEQVASLGAKFVEIPVEAQDAQTAGGYAKAQSEDFYRKQQEFLAERAHASDIIITTALVQGQRAPILVSEKAVDGMRSGSVIVDLASEQGGNCALTVPGQSVVKYGVTIHGPLNLPSTMAPQASQLFARNMAAFLSPMLKDGTLNLDTNDELIRGTMVFTNGNVVNEAVKSALSKGETE